MWWIYCSLLLALSCCATVITAQDEVKLPECDYCPPECFAHPATVEQPWCSCACPDSESDEPAFNFNKIAPTEPPKVPLPLCGCAPHCKTKEATAEDPTCHCICPSDPEPVTAAPPVLDPLPLLPLCGCAPPCKTKVATVEDPTCHCICPEVEPNTFAPPPFEPLLPLCGCAPPCKTKAATVEDPTCHCDCPDDGLNTNDEEGNRCKEFHCFVGCDFGFQFVRDTNGCQNSCDCEKVCAIPMCANQCPDSRYKKDKDGCETCDCEGLPIIQPADPVCAIPTCTNQCPESRYKKTEFGCETCECEINDAGPPAPPPCPPMSYCRKFCPDGFVMGLDGCRTCECNQPPVIQPIDGDDAGPPAPPPCPNMNYCRKFCLNGFLMGEDGCQFCECAPVCPSPLCTTVCATYRKDENGCQTCECEGGDDLMPNNNNGVYECEDPNCPTDCPPGTHNVYDYNSCKTCQCVNDVIPPPQPPIPMCPMIDACYPECDSYKKDANGCTTCECLVALKPFCDEPECYAPCAEGFRFKQDAEGCQMACDCEQDPEYRVGPPEPDCGPLCLMYCEFGNVMDERGCPTCQCIEPPKQDCEQVYCMLPCREGFRHMFDTQGCQQACDCEVDPDYTKPPCAQPICINYCDTGFARDLNGCETCNCVEPEPYRCPVYHCMTSCDLGYQQDSNGCNTCTCVAKKCPTLSRCLRPCEFGNVVDSNGCETCDCMPPVCAVPTCTNQCRNGYKNDKHGCQTCECEDSDHPVDRCGPKRFCWLGCKNGYVKDSLGCDTCQCNLSPPEPVCGPVCLLYCQHGNVMDERGCPTCKCNAPPCKPMDGCPLTCNNGFITDEASGCQICKCNPPREYTVAPVRPVDEEETTCRPVLCRMYCANGWATDPETGCEMCSCKPDIQPPTTQASLAPEPVKKIGRCPSANKLRRYTDRCEGDGDCEGNMKCCQGVCAKPLQKQSRRCPAKYQNMCGPDSEFPAFGQYRSHWWNRGFRRRPTCEQDTDCASNRICCGCSCVKPTKGKSRSRSRSKHARS